MEQVIVERVFETPVDDERLEAMGAAGAPCHALHRVKHLKTYLSADRLRMICIYEAPDAESVRISNKKAGLAFERAWSATVLER